MTERRILRARIVWPVSSAPIENGAVVIVNDTIQEVGAVTDLSKAWPDAVVEDLGEVALMPGLVNAHCHLDYTGMAGMLPQPSSFPEWVKGILALKAHWSYTEYAASWLSGARQLLESGCTTVYDIEAVPELLPEAWEGTPLRIISFLEMTGVKSGENPEAILAAAEANRLRLPDSDRHHAALSPHALYSTPPKLLNLVGVKVDSENAFAQMHLAESIDEWEMYLNRRGRLFDWLKTQRPMDDCGDRSPVQQAKQVGMLHANCLAVHCNYLAPGDAELLANHQVTVVHCPRSHSYFRHAPFELNELLEAGVNIALGTDSLASVVAEQRKPVTLDMWAELRELKRKHPDISGELAIHMATVNGGRALRRSVGELKPRCYADMISIRYSGSAEMLGDALISEPPRIEGRWIGGARV